MERTQIYLSEQQQRELDRRAHSSGRTKSDLIREALDGYLGLAESQGEWVDRWLDAIDGAAGVAPYLSDDDRRELEEADLRRRSELERRA